MRWPGLVESWDLAKHMTHVLMWLLLAVPGLFNHKTPWLTDLDMSADLDDRPGIRALPKQGLLMSMMVHDAES